MSSTILLERRTDAGRAGAHPARRALPIYVAPGASAAAFNSLQQTLSPVACWRMDDPRFAFDSSFIVPEARHEIGLLRDVIRQHAECPLSIFGHADSTNTDTYNKALSGRRAKALYGLLTHDTAVWEQLHSERLGGDRWGTRSVQSMLSVLRSNIDEPFYAGPIDDIHGPQTTSALQRFQSENGLTRTGQDDAATRQVLYAKYMSWLCTGDDGDSLLLESTRFMGRGEDPYGTGDYQGCSEFNPSLVLSEFETRRLANRHAERNAVNSVNRRVVVFLFRRGTVLDLGEWPCPTVNRGPDACRKRFWSDGDARRTPTASERRYEDTHDTFACRFYDRLAHASPCEGTGALKTVQIQLHDYEDHSVAGRPVRVTSGSHTAWGESDADGVVTLASSNPPDSVLVEWSPDSDNPRLHTCRRVHLALGHSDECDRKRLANLGYVEGSLQDRVRDYQADYGHPITGELSEIRDELRRFHDEGIEPGEGTSV